MLIARLDEYLVYSQPQWSSRYSVRKNFGYQPCYLILCSEEADHTYIMEKKKKVAYAKCSPMEECKLLI